MFKDLFSCAEPDTGPKIELEVLISFVWDIILFFSISVYFLGWGQLDFFIFPGFANITAKPESLWNVRHSCIFVLENVYTFLQTSINLFLSSLVLPDPPLKGALSAALLSFFHICPVNLWGIFQTAILCPVCQPKPVCVQGDVLLGGQKRQANCFDTS